MDENATDSRNAPSERGRIQFKTLLLRLGVAATIVAMLAAFAGVVWLLVRMGSIPS